MLKHPARTQTGDDIPIAAPLYSLILPITLLLGHTFIKYTIKLCDHVGRLLAMIGINPVRERQMCIYRSRHAMITNDNRTEIYGQFLTVPGDSLERFDIRDEDATG